MSSQACTHLQTEGSLCGNSVLVACGDEAQVRALRLEGLRLPPRQHPA